MGALLPTDQGAKLIQGDMPLPDADLQPIENAPASPKLREREAPSILEKRRSGDREDRGAVELIERKQPRTAKRPAVAPAVAEIAAADLALSPALTTWRPS